jgi:hypothetical protein
MPSPSPEAPPVPSAGGPLPEGPFPRWRRAAQGLRWMRIAIYAPIAGSVLGILISLGAGQSSPTRSFAGYLFWASYVLGYVAFAAGLWRFGSVPASTGAARPARQAFACLASGLGLQLLCCLPLVWPALVPILFGRLLIGFILLLGTITPVTLTAACGGLLVRALGAVLRSLGERPPTCAQKALGAWVAWWILTLTLSLALWLAITIGRPSALVHLVVVLPNVALPVAWGLLYVGGGAIALALASVMGRTARALARQESPETAPR